MTSILLKTNLDFTITFSDFILVTGPQQILHITEGDDQSCPLKNSNIDYANFYATGGVLDKEIYVCGGSDKNDGAVPATSSCTIFPSGKGAEPITVS